MSEPIKLSLGRFNEIVGECQVFLFITRDSDLQKQACNKLEDALVEIAAQKASVIAIGDEESANVLLGCECVANALIAEITMWLLLKNERPDEAWERLVAAQGHLSNAIRAHEGFAHLDPYIERLDAIEHFVFPPQIFLSSGMIVKSQICSICERDYEDCGHIKGRAYMGQFCVVRLIPSAVDHVAVVDNPANKRCRILKFTAEGGNRNRMTWRVEPSDGLENKAETQEFTTEAIIDTFGGGQDSLH